MEVSIKQKLPGNKVPDTIGGRIKVAREAYKIDGKPMSQGELARRIGVTRPAVSQWEAGDTHSLKVDNLLKLCRHLHVTQDFILHGKEVTKVHLSDEALELAHAYEKMPDSEWKERIFYFVTTYEHLNKVAQGEKRLSSKHPRKSTNNKQ